jgi:hypothetical protein
MAEEKREQRNAYKGNPARAVVLIQLISPEDGVEELKFLADTGNPCSLIISVAMFAKLCWRQSAATESNFGTLDGGWLRIVVPELEFDEKVLAYANDAVVSVVQKSDAGFAGLVGLPLLRLMEYGGDAETFWIRALPGVETFGKAERR